MTARTGTGATDYRRRVPATALALARGSAPVLVLVVAVSVLGASTSWSQAAGVSLVAAGIVFVRGFRREAKAGGVAFGLAIGCCIAAYTLVDKSGIRYASPVTYLELTMVPPAIAYTAAAAAGKGLRALRSEATAASVIAGL